MPRLGSFPVAAALQVVLVAVLTASCVQRPSEFDLIITNGQVVDGSGAPGFAADIAIRNDTIVHIGQLTKRERRGARKIINAQGLVVSPGFIDIHARSEYTLLVDGTAQSKIRQGVTTEILGESESPGPFEGKLKPGSPYGLKIDWRRLGEYFDRLEQNGVALNVASFVGASQVRSCILGEASRDPTRAEMEEMLRLVGEAMRDGAAGLSCALLVPPNSYLTTAQLIEMAKVIKQYGGTFFIHVRTEGEGIHQAVGEALEIAEKAKVPVEILHLKIADRRLWGRMKEICDLIERARSRGIKATADQYPYTAGQNDLVALIPPGPMEGSRELMSEEDVRYAMKLPWVSVGSDGAAVRPDGVLGGGRPHPRCYGTFPRILGKYVREEHVLTLEDAVRKMTSLNAEKIGITTRGLLKEGKKADITIFDPRSVIDRATFEDPHQYPSGIEHVIVNGVPVVENGVHLGTKPGKILRRIPFVTRGNAFCCTAVPWRFGDYLKILD
jgi:N-acyl-D-aspartate/D-glutamate deacylase